MKTTSLIAAALLSALLATSALAEPEKGDRGERLDYIFTQLELTEEQRAQVQDILNSTREEHRAAMRERRESDDGRPSREEIKALRKGQRQALEERLQTVLTAEQVEEFTTYLEAHRPHRGGGHPHHRKGKHPAPADPSDPSDPSGE